MTERASRGGCGKERIRDNRHRTRQKCNQMSFDEDIESDNFRGMKRVHSVHGYDNTKEHSMNTGPLKRYLRSNIGRPWNDVYSEIKKNINFARIDIVEYLVETSTYMDGDTVMISSYVHYPVNKYYRSVFYVDPRDGTLQYASGNGKYRKSKKKFRDTCYFDKNNMTVQYHKINNLWYEIKMREANQEEKESRHFKYDNGYSKYNMTDNKLVQEIRDNTDKFYAYAYYAEDQFWLICNTLFYGSYLPISKRQISSKEVKRIESLIKIRDEKNDNN